MYTIKGLKRCLLQTVPMCSCSYEQNLCKMSADKCFFLLVIVLLMGADCNAARRRKEKSTPSPTHEPEVTHAAAMAMAKGPDTDRIIYHSMRTNDRCECGVFKTPKKSVEEPIYYQTAMQNFNCDEVKCKSLCLSMPAFAESRSIEILCAHINSAVGIKPAVHYKNCNNNWLFAASTQDEPICCSDGKLIAC